MTLFGVYTLRIDRPLFLALLIPAGLGLLILYSATGENLDIVIRHALRLAGGFAVMLAIAQLRPETLARWTPYVFGIGVLLLIGVLGVGSVSKGAQRWLNLGVVRIQPSEIMKLAVPMMLGWYFARTGVPPRLSQLAVAALIILIPALLVAKQPDLGTAVLIVGAGGLILFLAGMGWRTLGAIVGLTLAALPVIWAYLHDYQRKRIFTLLDPTSDPLGAGYHTIQSMIAIGSGGFFGKGWLNSTQAHLEYLPDDRFRVRGIRRGIRPARHRRLAVGLSVYRGPRPDDRVFRPRHLHAPAGRRPDVELLFILLHQCRHGERYPAGGGRAAALD